MFNLKDFVPWDGDRSKLVGKAVLAYTKSEGYFFLTYQQATNRFFEGKSFSVKGVEK